MYKNFIKNKTKYIVYQILKYIILLYIFIKNLKIINSLEIKINMKRLIILLIGIIFLSCSSSKEINIKKINPEKVEKNIFGFSGKIDKESLSFIKENYLWNNEKILIINFRQPKSYCHFNNSFINNQSLNFQKRFYSKINTNDCLIINVLSNKKNIRKKLMQKKHYIDKNKYFLNNFLIEKDLVLE